MQTVTRRIISAAMEVHRSLGPGLHESAYEACLAFELRTHGLRVEQQNPLALTQCDVRLEYGYRLDLLAEEHVIVEIG
jgi:GxxExxY protein